MRKAYVLILIGVIFVTLHIKINNFDLLHDAVGYLLIGLGISEIKNRKPSSLIFTALWIAWGLLIINLIKPILFNFLSVNSIFYLILIICLLIAQFFVYYLILCAEGVSKFKRNYMIIGLLSIVLYILTCFIPIISIPLLLIGIFEVFYLIYIFYQLQKKYNI